MSTTSQTPATQTPSAHPAIDRARQRAAAVKSAAKTDRGIVRAAIAAMRGTPAIRPDRGWGNLREAERRIAAMGDTLARLAEREERLARLKAVAGESAWERVLMEGRYPDGAATGALRVALCRGVDALEQAVYALRRNADMTDLHPLRWGEQRAPRQVALDAVAGGEKQVYRPLRLTVRQLRQAPHDRRLRSLLRRRQRAAQIALHVARRYHHTVRECYSSRRSDWHYGLDSIQREEYDIYSKAWHRVHGPYRWSDPGCIATDTEIIISPVRGRQVRLPLPPAALQRAWLPAAPHPRGLLAARTTDPGVVACWDVVAGKWSIVALAIDGVEVPQSVAAGRYTAADVLAEPNAEVRAIMARRYAGGWDRLIADAGLKPIHADERGELYEVPGGRQRIVRVRDATSGQTYCLSVPPTCVTAAGAVAWTFGAERADEYHPAAEA